MKQLTVSRITFERIKNHPETTGFDLAGAIESNNGTVTFPVTDDVHECLELLGVNIEQSIISMLNSQ